MIRAHIRRLAALSAVLALALAVTGCTASADSSPSGLSGVGTLPAPASAWPAPQYDARHSSGTAAIGPQTAAIRWSTQLTGAVVPGPVIGTDGSILVATNSGILTALNPRDGSVRWSFDGGGSYGFDLSTSPAVLADGTIVWPGTADTLFGLSASGHREWSLPFDGVVLSPAVAGRDRVYVADGSGHLTALVVQGGKVTKKWRLALGDTSFSSPSVGPEGNIYTSDATHLYAVRDLGASGVVRWSFTTKKMIEVSSAVAPDGTVILGTNHDKEYGIRSDGTVRWAIDIGDYTYSSSTATPAGLAYFADNTGRVRAVKVSTGKVVELLRPLGPTGKEHAWTSVAVDAAGDMYWGTQAGHLYGYTADGTQLFAADVGSGVPSYPALGGDGTLYVGTLDGRVLAVGGTHGG